jgi:hypothetical protein
MCIYICTTSFWYTHLCIYLNIYIYVMYVIVHTCETQNKIDYFSILCIYTNHGSLEWGKCIFVSIHKNYRVALSKTHQGWQTPELPLGFLKEMVYPSIWSILIFLKKPGHFQCSLILQTQWVYFPTSSLSPKVTKKSSSKCMRAGSHAWEGSSKKRVPVCLSLMEWTRVLSRKK